MKINPVIDFSRNNQDVFLSQLKDFIKIPSISSNPSNNQDIQNCAKFVYDDLKRRNYYISILTIFFLIVDVT